MINKDNASEWLPIVTALAEGKQIQWWNIKEWINVKNLDMRFEPESFRIAPEQLAPVKVPLTADDIPALCWLRKEGLFIHHLVTSIDVEGIESSFGWISFLGLKDDRYKYSTDRKTWLPCSKEVL